MKSNKKERFENYYKKFIENFNINDEFIIWGGFSRFKQLKKITKDKLNIKYCVDIDKKKQGTVIEGIPILAPENIKNETDVKVIVATQAYREVYEMLEEFGLKKEEYCNYMDITCFWNWFYNKKLVLNEVNFIINNICTLKCKGCIAFVNCASEPRNILLEDVKNNFDNLFNSIDFIDTIQISGGEVFLYKDLEKVFEYIYVNYNEKYGNLNITTNGTIIPSLKVFEACKNYNVLVTISDYSRYIGNKSVASELANILEKDGINYKYERMFGIISGENKWFDMGDPLKSRNLSEENLINLFNNCTSVCRCLYNSKLYYCNRQACASFNLDFEEKSEDYFDLRESAKKVKEEYALELIKYNLGCLELGYLSFCDRCNGFGELVNKNYIYAGEQIE